MGARTAGGSLAGGVLIDGTVHCLWHGSQFDAKTGQATLRPREEADPRVRGEGDEGRPGRARFATGMTYFSAVCVSEKLTTLTSTSPARFPAAIESRSETSVLTLPSHDPQGTRRLKRSFQRRAARDRLVAAPKNRRPCPRPDGAGLSRQPAASRAGTRRRADSRARPACRVSPPACRDVTEGS